MVQIHLGNTTKRLKQIHLTKGQFPISRTYRHLLSSALTYMSISINHATKEGQTDFLRRGEYPAGDMAINLLHSTKEIHTLIMKSLILDGQIIIGSLVTSLMQNESKLITRIHLPNPIVYGILSAISSKTYTDTSRII